MAKSYKPAGETSSKNRLCLKCFNCKSRVFRDLDELAKWCYKREMNLGVIWRRRFKKEGELRIYWCTVLPWTKPRIYRLTDLPFKMNCDLFDEGEVDG